ncbi:hypothetical protein [Streptomyces sp. NBC_01396]
MVRPAVRRRPLGKLLLLLLLLHLLLLLLLHSEELVTAQRQ